MNLAKPSIRNSQDRGIHERCAGMRCRLLFALIPVCLSTLVAADAPPELTGEVVGVHDGDTLTIRVGEKEKLTIRLDGIDAPELAQPYGKQAKHALSSVVIAKEVRVETHGTDKYGRTIGTVWLAKGKQEYSVNHQLVAKGWAWRYVKYSKSRALAEVEAAAKKAHLGLWTGADPVSPWDWRAAEKKRKDDAKAEADAAKADLDAAVAARKAKRELDAPAQAEIATKLDSQTERTPRPEESESVTERPAEKFWLNTKTGKRHNSGCRWYGDTKNGKFCGPDEGVACKVCGG